MMALPCRRPARCERAPAWRGRVEQGSRRPRRATRIRHRAHLCMRAYARLPGLARARRGARERGRSKYTRPQEPWGRHCYTTTWRRVNSVAWGYMVGVKGKGSPALPLRRHCSYVQYVPGSAPAPQAAAMFTLRPPHFPLAFIGRGSEMLFGARSRCLPPRPRALARSLPSTRRRPCASPIDARTLYACMWLLVYLAGSFDIDSAAQRIQ